MIRARLAAGAPFDCLALGVAGWMRYVSGRDEAGRPIAVSDPLAAEFASIASDSGIHRGANPEALVDGLLGIRAIFGSDLPADPRFTRPVRDWLASLFAAGAARTVAKATQPVARAV